MKEEKSWLVLHNLVNDSRSIKRPHELEKNIILPPAGSDEIVLSRIQGSMIGLALGDALGAHVEFRPRAFLLQHPVTELQSGGTWGLEKGQFTDDTSMALCLAASLISCRDFIPYDQLVRYKWWYRHGYMSSTGHCFDIGTATSESLGEFERRQNDFSRTHQIPLSEMDTLADPVLLNEFNVKCSGEGVAGNGALMRLAPVPLFFFRHPSHAVEFSGLSGEITHGDRKAYDACRYYGALIVAAVNGMSKDELLSEKFVENNESWFGGKELAPEILEIAVNGSFKRQGGYDDGIRGKGYIVSALEAALWAFWSTKDFEQGALAAVNLGDDTDTTAAIYGQLAGAYYGYEALPQDWVVKVYAKDFILGVSKWLAYEGEKWSMRTSSIPAGVPETEEHKLDVIMTTEMEGNEHSDKPSASFVPDPKTQIPKRKRSRRRGKSDRDGKSKRNKVKRLRSDKRCVSTSTHAQTEKMERTSYGNSEHSK